MPLSYPDTNILVGKETSVYVIFTTLATFVGGEAHIHMAAFSLGTLSVVSCRNLQILKNKDKHRIPALVELSV